MSTDVKAKQIMGRLGARIITVPPGPKSRRLAEELIEYESPSSSSISDGKIPVVWEEARGANIKDVDGNVYIDLTGAFCVAGVGHANPKVVEAISKQAGKLLHSQGVLNPSPPRVELVKKLAELTPGDLKKSILVNTGAEAVELALKTAKIYTGRYGAIAFHGGFHGKTFGALSLTSRNAYREPFLPLFPEVTHVPFAYCYRCAFGRSYPECNIDCAKYLEYLLNDPSSAVSNVAAIILEVIQGHDGWIVPPPEFMPEIRRICDKKGILMIADEIITGFGRTGRMFGVDHYEVIPDIMILAKGVAGGFPISAVTGKEEIMNAWEPALHSSTFLGNPVGCAACLAAIKEIEDNNLVERAKELGDYMLKTFSKMMRFHPLIGDVRGKGMMVGIELVKDRNTKEPASRETGEIVLNAQSQGIIVNQGGKFGNVLKTSPPFVITEEQLDEAMRIIEECVYEVEK